MRQGILLFLFFCTGMLSAQKADVIVQLGHFEEISSAALSPNGKLAATGSKDKSVIVYDVSTGLQMATYRGFNGWVVQLQFARDNNRLVCSSTDNYENRLMVWDVSKNDTVYSVLIGDMGRSFRFRISDDEKIIVFRYDDGFKIFDFKTGNLLYEIPVDDKIKLSDNWELTHDGKKIICEDEDDDNPALIVLDLEQKKPVLQVVAPDLARMGTISVEASVVTKDDKYYLRSKGPEKWLKYEIATGALAGATTPVKKSYSSPSDYHLAGDGKTLMVNFGSEIAFFDVETGKMLKGKSYGSLGYSEASAISSNGKQAVFSCGPHGVNLAFLDVASAKVVRLFKGVKANPTCAEFSNNSKNLAISSWNLPYKVWNMQTADGVKSLPDNTTFQEDNPGNMTFSPDDQVLLTGGNYPVLVNLPTLESKKYNHHFYYNYKLRPNHGKDAWVKIDPGFEKLIKGNEQYRMSDGYFMCDYGEDIYQAYRSFTPDGKYAYCVTTRDQDRDSVKVIVYDAMVCKKVKEYVLANEDANSSINIALSADGKRIALMGNDITVAELLTGKVLYHFTEEQLESKGFASNFRCCDIEFSVSGNDIIAAEEDTYTIRVFSLAQGKVTYSMKGHNAELNSIRCSPDGKMLVSTARDGKVVLWNPNNGMQVATFVALDSTDFVVITPDNYYMATKKGLKAVAFRVGNKMFPVEQFDLRQNRPDTVLQRMGTASGFLIKMYKMAWEKRLKKAGYTPAMLGTDFNIPQIEISDKLAIPSLSKSEKISFGIQISDSLYYLDRYNVYVNDVPVYGMNGVSLRKKKVKTFGQQIEVPLSNGANRIQVSAFNEKGAESMRETFEVFYENSDQARPDLYILAIGVSHYKDAQRSLKFAAKDATDLAAMLQAKSQKFGTVNVKLITDKDAVLKNVVSAKDFLAAAGTNDQVVLYFSGHGLLDEQLNYYLALHDVDFNNPSAGGLPYDVFEKMVDSIPCRNRLVLIDACHSGEVDKEDTEVLASNNNPNVTSNARSGNLTVKPKAGLKNSFEYMQALFTDVQKGTGATIISAAGGMEFALESKDWNNGVFTYSIMKGLDTGGADLNKDGKIVVSELRRFVGDMVFELTNGSQRPTTRKENTGNDFAIY
ncbi:MAG: caspase family protein [Bacteroidota bacterium]